MNWLLRLKRQWGDIRTWRHPLSSIKVGAILLCAALMPSRTLAALLVWLLLSWVTRAVAVGKDLGNGRVLRVMQPDELPQVRQRVRGRGGMHTSMPGTVLTGRGRRWLCGCRRAPSCERWSRRCSRC